MIWAWAVKDLMCLENVFPFFKNKQVFPTNELAFIFQMWRYIVENILQNMECWKLLIIMELDNQNQTILFNYFNTNRIKTEDVAR